MILLVPGVLLGTFIAYKQHAAGSNQHMAIPLEDIEEGGIGIRGMNAPARDDANGSSGTSAGTLMLEMPHVVTSGHSRNSTNSAAMTESDAYESDSVSSDYTDSGALVATTSNPLQRDNLVLRI
jgi:hypothetical protein